MLLLSLTTFLCLSGAMASSRSLSAPPAATIAALPQPAAASVTVTATLSPNPVSPTPTKPSLAARCENPPCEYGGQAETLSAATVTSTIMSTTSVPCYITTYVTDSTTTTETIYSTETITSTVTEQNTVWIIKYSPTPVVKSTVFESVIQITQTQTSMWVETEGGYYEETKTGDVQTVDGGQSGDKGGYGGGGEWKDAGSGSGSGQAPAPAPAPAANSDQGQWKPAGDGAQASSVPAPVPAPAPSSQRAWTHATAAAVATPAAGVNAAGGGVGVGVAGTSWTNAGQGGGGGVTVAGRPVVAGVWPNATVRSNIANAWPVYLLTMISIIGGAFMVM